MRNKKFINESECISELEKLGPCMGNVQKEVQEECQEECGDLQNIMMPKGTDGSPAAINPMDILNQLGPACRF